MDLQEGDRTPEVRRERPRLAPRAPLIELALAGFNFDGFNVEETRRFGNALLRERNKWADEHRHGRRYSDAGLARHQNRLASYRRDGAK